MAHSNNPYNLFHIKQGERFTSTYFKGIVSVRSVHNAVATVDFEDAVESHRNGETWTTASMEEEIRILDLHRLTSFQFRRKSSDGSFSRGFGFWEDMADQYTWGFVCQFLPDYERRDDVATSDDLACVIDKEKSLEWLYEVYPEWNGFTIEELKKVRAQWDYELAQEAEGYLTAATQSGEIEVREFPVSITSARILGEGEEDGVWLQCADQTLTAYGTKFTVPSSALKNVQSRWLDEGTDKEQFQIFYEHPSSGDSCWCNAQSIDFE
jgi:hypothetical protein